MLLLLSLNLFAEEAQRIISTAPSITETLFAMGLGRRVVGDTIYCNFPQEAQKLPRIGTLLQPDIEAILALKPDLVVVLKQPNDVVPELVRLHIKTLEVDSQNLDQVYAAARSIGAAADAGAAAERMIEGIQTGLLSLKQVTAGKPKPSVLFVVGHTPGKLEDLFAGSGASYFSDLLESAGGTDILADVTAAYPKVSLEEILSRNPDVIFELSGDTAAKQQEVLSLWRTKSSLKAVQTGRVYALNADPFLVPGPRAIEAAKILLHFLHPEIKP